MEVISETEFRFKVKSAPDYRVWTKVIVTKNLNKQLILSESALKNCPLCHQTSLKFMTSMAAVRQTAFQCQYIEVPIMPNAGV